MSLYYFMYFNSFYAIYKVVKENPICSRRNPILHLNKSDIKTTNTINVPEEKIFVAFK